MGTPLGGAVTTPKGEGERCAGVGEGDEGGEGGKRVAAGRDPPRPAQQPSVSRWRELRSSKLRVAFKRQTVLGERFIVDFVAPREKLVVEIDGPYHRRRVQADARRDRALERLGYRVLRLEAEMVERNMAGVLRRTRGRPL